MINSVCNGSNTSYICNYVQILIYTDPMQIVYLCPDIGIRWPNVSVMLDWINQLDSMLFGQSYSRIFKAGANHIHSRSEPIIFIQGQLRLRSLMLYIKGARLKSDTRPPGKVTSDGHCCYKYSYMILLK